MQEGKKCFRCGCSIVLVPLFNTYTEECSACPRGPIPFKVETTPIGNKGTVKDLVDRFGFHIKLKYDVFVLIPVSKNYTHISCDFYQSDVPPSISYYDWPIEDTQILEIIR